MPYKNDNLEELFNKAANDYPLRTDTSNWNSVAARLNNPETKVVANRNNKWKYAAILILLLGGGALLYTDDYLNSEKHHAKEAALKDLPAKPNHDNSSSEKNKSFQSLNDNVVVNNATEDNAVIVQDKKVSSNISIVKTTSGFSMLNKAGNNYTIGNINTPFVELNTTSSANTVSNNLSIQDKKEDEQQVVENKLQNASDAEQSQTETTNSEEDNNAQSIYQQGAISYKPEPSKFYGSLYGGPEFSTIKSQKVDKPGYKVGIALAYRLSNRFDVEVGLQREKINYFTTGRYFDKAGLKIKDEVALENLTAQSSLTSVPVTIRYNFQSKKNGHFYVGTGVDFLTLTHSEKYQYLVTKNGTPDGRSKNYKSVTGPKYFSSINATAGYQNKLCNWCNYKVEPYYQIPTTKLSVGKLPISTFGLNVGIVKDLR